MQVEALHIWRLCADHNINLMHLDDAYPSMCRLLEFPSSSSVSRQSDAARRGHVTTQGIHVAAAHGNVGPFRAKQLLQKVQMQGSCQAYLLLRSLVCHAVR